MSYAKLICDTLYNNFIIAKIDIFTILYCINCNNLAKFGAFFYSKSPLISYLLIMNIRYKQASKEAKLSLLLTIIYLIAWIFTAYFGSDEKGLLGLPLWFELSCILVPFVFIILCWIVVRVQFKNIPLEQTK